MDLQYIRILKDFRNYFKELKEDGDASALEINILKQYFVELNSSPNYFTDNNRYHDRLNLLKLLNCVKNKMENDKDLITNLHSQLFY